MFFCAVVCGCFFLEMVERQREEGVFEGAMGTTKCIVIKSYVLLELQKNEIDKCTNLI